MSPPTKATYEPLLNGRLAQLLQKQNLPARAEIKQPGSRKQIDIEINLDGFIIVLEAEINSPTGAFRDARSRIEQHRNRLVNADIAIAINYPADLHQDRFNSDTKIDYFVIDQAYDTSQIPKLNDFNQADVVSLSPVIKQLKDSLRADERYAAKTLVRSIQMNAANFSPDFKRRLKSIINQYGQPNNAGQAIDLIGRRALLIIASAGIFHAHLKHSLSQGTPPKNQAGWRRSPALKTA